MIVSILQGISGSVKKCVIKWEQSECYFGGKRQCACAKIEKMQKNKEYLIHNKDRNGELIRAVQTLRNPVAFIESGAAFPGHVNTKFRS